MFPFGFYNYLENRYRAMELARALVQTDVFFDEKGRGKTHRYQLTPEGRRLLPSFATARAASTQKLADLDA